MMSEWTYNDDKRVTDSFSTRVQTHGITMTSITTQLRN